AGVGWAVGRRSVDRTRGIDAAILAATSNPQATRVRLASGDGRRHVDAVLLPNGSGYLVDNNLPTLPDGRTYQLWGVIGGAKVSLGVLGNAPAKAAFAAKADVAALAITAERAGGVVASAEAPVVSGSVRI
ncbi:MAG: anti-sigma factor, partial [Actinobacteria bacterium]|nr:anti-sigma factor [Actinomycetota bacterium]